MCMTKCSLPVYICSQVDPLDDIDVINLELALADLEVISKRLERLKKGEEQRYARSMLMICTIWSCL